MWLLLLVASGCQPGGTDPNSLPGRRIPTITVAAAADLQFALQEIVAEFTKENPRMQVNTTFGSSGNFFSQLSQRAPFDMFLSADQEYPRGLVQLGFAKNSDVFTYAYGQVALWTRHDTKIALDDLGLQSLKDPAVRRIALANPKHAPYGRAAQAILKHAGLQNPLRVFLVYGENVAQAAQFAASGNAEIGIIALSLALAPAMREAGHYWQVPAHLHPTLQQTGVILANTQQRAECLLLRAFLLGPKGQEILQRHGFRLSKE